METTQTTESSPTTQSSLVTLTEAAVVEVRRLMDVQDLTEGGLRLGVKGGGCSGLSYTINFDDKIGEFDTVCEQDGVKVLVDAKSAIYLEGMQLDYQKDLVSGGFKFINPNASKTCGCGESFSA
jgi:iron-sulfur cluster assembly protein